MRRIHTVALAALFVGCGRLKPAVVHDGGGDADSGVPEGGAPEVSTTCVFPPRITGDLRLASKAVLGDGLVIQGAAIAPDGSVFLSGMSDSILRVGGQVIVDQGQEIGVVLAFDAHGAPLWQRTLPPGINVGDLGRDDVGRLYVTIENEFTTGDPAGAGFPGGTSLVQLTANGASVWAHGLPAPIDGPLAATPGGKVVVASQTGQRAEAHLTTFDATGTMLGDAVISAELLLRVAWDGAGHVVVAGEDDGPNAATGNSDLTGFVEALDGAGMPLWKRWFAPSQSVTALATRGARVAAAGAFDQAFALDGFDAATSGSGSLFVTALDEPAAGDARGSWLDVYASSPDSSRQRVLAFDARGGLVVADRAGAFVDLGTGALSAPGPFLLRLDDQGHTKAALVLSGFAGIEAVAVDAADIVVVVGATGDAVDLGDGDPIPPQSFFLATYAPMMAPSAPPAPSCPPLVDGALLDSVHWQGVPTSMALGADRIYFTNGTEVASIPLASGTPQILATGQNRAVSLVLSNGVLYWANAGDNGANPAPGAEIMTLAPGAAAPTSLVTGTDHPIRVAADGGSIYWVAAGKLWSLTPPSTVPVPLAPAFAATNALAAAAGHVVFATDKHELVSVSSSPGGGDVIASATGDVLDIAVDADAIYWLERAAPSMGLTTYGDLRSVPFAGGPITTLDTARPSPSDLTVSGDRLYWSESTPAPGGGGILDGAVRWVAKAGGPRMTVTEGASEVHPMAADARNVAWLAYDKFGAWAVLTSPR
jgi:hypothetical protein